MKLAKLLCTDGQVHTVNLDAVLQPCPNSPTTTVLYFSNYCLANGLAFEVTEAELADLMGVEIALSEAADKKLNAVEEETQTLEAV